MKFDYNEEQQLVADSVRRFVAQDYAFETRKRIVASKEGWSHAVWTKLAEIGLLGLPFPPEYGGFGGRAVDLMSVMEAFGDALLVEPYLSTRSASSFPRSRRDASCSRSRTLARRRATARS